MKIFKKAISLVLVFAMLASFAGMTGFTPGIIASAATPTPEYQTVTFGANGQYSVKVAKTWYKMTFNESGYQPICNNDTEMDPDYYGIPYGYPGNDLNIWITAPEGGAWAFFQFITDRETTDGSAPDLNNPGNSWGAGGALAGASCSNPTAFNSYLGKTMNRDGHTFERDELGNLFKSTAYKLNSDEKRGFMDVDTIYLVLAYKDTDGATKFGYIDVAVEFAPTEIKLDDLSAKTSTTKPLDSKSGIKAAEVSIDMPTTLYKSSDGKSILTTVNDNGLDTTLGITLPTDAYNATVKAVPFDESKTLYTWPLSGGSNTVNLHEATVAQLTDGYPWAILRLDYTIDVPNTPYNIPTNSVVDTNPNATPSEIISGEDSPFLDESVYGETADMSVSDTVSVTYTQYMAAYVRELPRHKIAQFWGVENKYWGETRKASFYQRINLAPFIADSGFDIVLGDTGDNATVGASGYGTTAPTWPTWFNGTLPDGSVGWDDYTYRYVQDPEEADGKTHWLMGDNKVGDENNISTSASIGATIYFDVEASGAQRDSVSVPIYSLYDASGSAWSSMGSRPDFESGSSYYYFGTGTKGGTWTPSIVNSSSSKTSGTNYTHMYFNGKSSDSWTSNLIQLSENEKVHMSNNMVFYKAAYDDTATYLFYTRPQSSEKRRTFCLYLGYYFEFIEVGRSTEHDIINKAKTKNYVKAEMDPTWWESYKKQVVYSYIACGDLTNAVSTEGKTIKGWLDYELETNGKKVDNPIYKMANYDNLAALIGKTPYYDRGNAAGTPASANAYIMQPGAGYVAVIGDAKTAIDDPQGKKYGDYAGNGVNNIYAADLYRYSGAYFYTEESWKKYAIERYYAANVMEYYNASVPHQTFWYGSAYAPGKVSMLYCYYQDKIDETTNSLKAAYEALELRTLAGLKMRNDYDGGGAWVVSNGTQVIGYSAIIAYLDSLIPREKFTYYSGLKDSDGDGFMDTLVESEKQLYDTTALETALANLKNQYKAEDTVISKGIAFEAEIKAFLQLVKETKDNPVRAENDIWKEIFKFINTTLADKYRPSEGIIANGFADAIERIAGEAYGVYTLTEAQKNNFNALITTYNTAADPDSNNDYKSKKKATEQGPINDAVNSFFEALKQSFPSLLVSEAATNALAVPTAPGSTFEVYAPEQNANKQYSKYDPTSIGNLQTKVAEDLAGNSFQFNKTKWSTIDMLATTISNRATFENEGKGGQLRQAYVVTEHMNIALAKAESYITPDKLTQTLTSPSGETVEWSYYTAQSVAELQYVIDQAKKVGAEQPYENQLAVDKLTFALYDEADDSIGNLLTSDWPVAPRVWAYDDNGMPTGYTDGWGASIFATNLYGDRLAAANGTDEGLKPNTAYYEFLIKELSTPYTSDGITVDGGKLWDAETGWIKVGADGKVPVDSGIFNETWGQYVTACNTALELYNAYKNGTPLTVDRQEDITKAAQAVYDTRNALQFATYNFDKDDMYEKVKGYYATLSAYVQKTDVTRYGYEYIYVTDETTEELVKTSDIQKSADPLSSVVQSVYIYTGVTPELEAALTEFYAKYASDTPTAKAGTWLTEGGGKELYDSIVAMTEGCVVKKTDDATLTAGFNDLVENYIAGTWKNGVYTSTLLNSTQVETLNGKQGVTGLLPAAQAIITPDDGAAADATSAFGGNLAYATNAIFNYTKNPATNLQFATYMRDSELFALLDYTYTNDPMMGGQLVSYYYQDGIYTYRLIKEAVANQIKGEVNDYFADENNWPKIYEVNGETWGFNEFGDAIVDGYNDHYVDEEGNPGEAWGEYKGENEKICEILDLVASRAFNYSNAITRGLMPVKSEHYTWLLNNAIKNFDGIDYVLADASAVSAADEAPFNYDVSVNSFNDATQKNGWYTAGYGVENVADGKYYLYYNDAEGVKTPSWFEEYSRMGLEEQLDLVQFANNGIGYTYDEEGNTAAFSSIDELEAYTPSDLVSLYNGVTLADIVNTPALGYYVGYSELMMSYIVPTVGQIQGAIDKITNEAYGALHALELLPATEAYRDVYNTYLSVRGEYIADANWLDESIHMATSVDGKQQIDKVDFTFYNVSQANKIANMEPALYTKENPQYGVVSKTYNLLSKYDQASESWTNMMQFIEDFTAKGDRGDLITIDQAVKVNTYGTIDGEDTVKKVLIDQYLSKLEFKEISFDLLYNVVNAFLSGNLQKNIDFDSLIREDIDIVSEYGTYYPLADAQDGKLIDYYYTEESLLNIASYLLNVGIINDEIVKFVKNEPVWAENFAFGAIQLNNQYKGDFEDNVYTEQDVEDVLIILASFLANDLDFNLADTAELSAKIAEFKSANPAEKYEHNDDWNNYIAQLDAAELLVKEVTENVDGEWDIRRQDEITAQLNALVAAELLIDLLADNYAPQMTLKTSVGDVKSFYSNEAYEIALSKADAASFTDAGVADPAAGTFFVPNSSGYSLIVYTNELNPRIVINLEDLEQNLAGTGSTAVWQEAAKQEYISINAKRTSGVKTNVIAGTIVPATDGNGKVMSVLGQTGDAPGISEATSTDAVTVENNSAINGKPVKGSSAFAILAPTFVKNKATQAAVYTIEARDGSNRTVDGGTVDGNAVNQFDFGGAGQEPVDIEVLDTSNRIAIYVYYYSLKAADGTEEGINATGTALATPAISGTNVPNALLSGEPGFKGEDWRNGILLQRHFSDSHRVWEYVSEIKQNAKKQYNVNGTQVPVYNDPTFGYLNTGSFYYVLDEKVAADASIINAYKTAKSTTTAAGCMDYSAATVAKTAMINAIKAMSVAELEALKKSSRFYNYGDYETNEYGEVLTDNGEPKWINWAQSLNNKVENGDLVFVHVVDRWGNVVNRIVEITNLDKIGPAVNSAAAGEVTISEDGGSGLKDITVHNGDFSLGNFDYEESTSQKVNLGETAGSQVSNKATVESADDKLTITGLVPGKLYYIGAYDNAGNAGSTPVKANADGKITLTVSAKTDKVETGEEGGIVNNSLTFTLNGTDTIILNSGETSSVINADFEGNVFANRYIEHLITTLDTVTGLKTVYQDGTVEEWTSANAYIQNNGDGTLTWTIARKFAEGEHSYKVYAKVGDTYETFYAPANFFATTKSVRVTYRVAGPGSTVLLFGGTSEIVSSNHNSLTVPYGSKVTITAKTNTAGSDFYYWTNNTTDRIISTENVLEFKAVSNVDFVAQFTNTSTYTDGKKFVVYVNNAKNIIERFELADGANYKVPTGPVLPDYTFKGWSMTKDEVLESDKKTIIVEPIYELNTSNTVTITEGNYTATGAGTYTAEGNQRAVVTISADAKDGDGKDFLYWIDAENGEIVSYARTYTFFCVKDSELTPVYGDASTVKAEPIVRITEVKFNALSGKVSFFAERSVPEEYMILQTGIVVTKTEAIGTNEDVFVVGGTSTAAGTSTSTANNGFYSANATVATGQTVWARAYVIYENADGEIFEAYGPVVSYTVD